MDGIRGRRIAVIVGVPLTLWEIVPRLPSSAALPEYCATIVLVPTSSEAVVTEATPFTRDAIPRIVVPLRNVTVPVDCPIAGGTAWTVAANVIGPPNGAGLADDVSVVAVRRQIGKAIGARYKASVASSGRTPAPARTADAAGHASSIVTGGAANGTLSVPTSLMSNGRTVPLALPLV